VANKREKVVTGPASNKLKLISYDMTYSMTHCDLLQAESMAKLVIKDPVRLKRRRNQASQPTVIWIAYISLYLSCLSCIYNNMGGFSADDVT